MTAPGEVRIARHAADIDDDGHHSSGSPEGDILPWRVAGDILFYDDQTDVALGGTAWADSTYSTFVASNVNDGNDATYHLSVDPTTNRFVAIDLGDALEVTAWRAKQGGGTTERADTWHLDSSTDGIAWTSRVTGSVFFTDTGVLALTAPITARYWRLFAITGGSGGWALFTLSLYAASPERLPIGDEGDVLTVDAGLPAWAAGGGAPTTADYLVGTTQAGLSAEIVVGTTPGGELGGTWASPTVDATHSGSSHADILAAAGGDHVHVVDEQFSGDASTTVFYLANEAAPDSVMAWVSGVRTPVTLGGMLNDEITFGSAPASASLNISVDYAAVLA